MKIMNELKNPFCDQRKFPYCSSVHHKISLHAVCVMVLIQWFSGIFVSNITGPIQCR